jgi:hypothetical protein
MFGVLGMLVGIQRRIVCHGPSESSHRPYNGGAKAAQAGEDMTRFVAILSAALLCGCATDRASCPLDSQRPMTVAELFFGRDIPGRGALTDQEWSKFAAQFITPEFPQGFTVTDGEGEWRDPATAATTQERAKIVIVAALPAPDLVSRISIIRNAYSRLYRQTSVGTLTYNACGAF